ncbi:MAG: hypothetical protein AB1540_06390 [Bdellovibrionota bacterium]
MVFRSLVMSIAAAAVLFSACAKQSSLSSSTAASTSLESNVAVATESLLSLIANELGPPAGPPTPGALALQSCVKLSCQATRGSATISKRLPGCTTAYGSLDGNTTATFSGMPELNGCSTTSGPAALQTWPISRGTHQLEMHYTRTESRRFHSTHSGTVTAYFNGTNVLSLEVDHRVATETKRYQFSSANTLRLTLEGLAENHPRIFEGTLDLVEATAGSLRKYNLTFNGVTIQKNSCCHPRSGSLTVQSISEDEFFTVHFAEPCGTATLSGYLGQSMQVALPEC